MEDLAGVVSLKNHLMLAHQDLAEFAFFYTEQFDGIMKLLDASYRPFKPISKAELMQQLPSLVGKFVVEFGNKQ